MQRLDPASLEIRPLTDDDDALVHEFTCGDEDLDDFLRTDAKRLQTSRTVRTFIALYEGRLMGFIALLSDAVVLGTRERKLLAMMPADHPVIPALKIARLGVSRQFRECYRGAGTALVKFARAKALMVSAHAGCRILTVDAYPHAVPFYQRLGFVPNRAKIYREKSHPSMRLDVLMAEPPGGVSTSHPDGGT